MNSIIYMFREAEYPYGQIDQRRINDASLFKEGDFISLKDEHYLITSITRRYEIIEEKMIITILVRKATTEEVTFIDLTSGK